MTKIYKLIFFYQNHTPSPPHQELRNLLHNRGPNCNNQYIHNQYIHNDDNELIFIGYVLWQQGLQISQQPIITENYILLFNGDIFNADRITTTTTATKNESDTDWLISNINKCENDHDLVKLFKTIEGPFSIILYKKDDNTLFFMRDSLGRNSLCIESDEDSLKILSVSYISSDSLTMELPALGIYKLYLNTFQTGTIYPWTELNENECERLKQTEKILGTELNINQPVNSDWLLLSEKRQPKFIFSELVDHSKCTTEILYDKLLECKEVEELVDHIIMLLSESLRERIINTPPYCSDCLKNILTDRNTDIKDENLMTCDHGKIGILFSGGVDCTILAALADKYIKNSEPIDLINVAFEKISNKDGTEVIDWDVPDRLTAKTSYCELKSVFPDRNWNLVEVNVQRKELEHQLKNHIRHLIYPLETVLDESLGCAFWFAARGQGLLNGEEYTSKCRVILLGSGADELFGGYVRHRNSFKRANGNINDKSESLHKELEMDWKRISTRNFGRDDRIISDQGKTPRTPFIQENFVKFVRNIHPLEKCCFDFEEGIGDKLILRLCAHKLGIKKSSQFKKRAIQFGSRIANKKQNANDISIHLMKKEINIYV